MAVEPAPGPATVAAEKTSALSIALSSQRFDLPGPVPLRKSYIIASTPRCGSTFLATRLWATGVLGAPAEYFGYQKQLAARMMERLQAASPADYLDKLLACRTSNNGVFGVNFEFNDFDEALRRFPGMLERLAPITYIFVDRQDQLVQATFMAKAVQADMRNSKRRQEASASHYDRDLISKWLGRIERQKLGWMRWFAANGIAPFVVTYEQMTMQPAAAARSIVELLRVDKDEPQKLRVALAERPTDRISKQWAARFEREIERGIEHRPADTAVAEPRIGHANQERKAVHIFDRYDAVTGAAPRPIAAKRLRHRYQAIVACNRDLFKNARVLDLRSGDGYWSLAAMDAGAARVVGVDGQQEAIEAATKAFEKIGVKPAFYEFVNAKFFAALTTFTPKAFDLVLCREVSSDPHFFFKCLRRLQPKHVILDTKIIGRQHAVAAFTAKQLNQDKAGSEAEQRPAFIDAVPSYTLIALLCDYFGFRCRVLDWHALGIADWTGVRDYERGRRCTYVIEPIS